MIMNAPTTPVMPYSGRPAPWGWTFKIDKSAEQVYAIAQAQDRRNIKRGDADGENVDHRRQDARAGQRQGHAPNDFAVTHAVHARRFFERRIHGAKHLRGQDERQRGETQSLNEAHADGRGDIDRRVGISSKRSMSQRFKMPMRGWAIMVQPMAV